MIITLTPQVLKILNSNVESPYLIWDNSTRAELTEFVESERTSSIRRGVCDPAFGSEFQFSAHKGELVVGNVFVRIYNQQPMFQLEVGLSVDFYRKPRTRVLTASLLFKITENLGLVMFILFKNYQLVLTTKNSAGEGDTIRQ
jgi:hypothetical protein